MVQKTRSCLSVLEDYEHFVFEHAQKPYIEFPIMADGQPYDGDSSPGTDRVVRSSLLFFPLMRTKVDICVYRFLDRLQATSNPLCTAPSSPMMGTEGMGSPSAKTIQSIRMEVEYMTSIRPLVVEENLTHLETCWSSLCFSRSGGLGW